MLLGYLFSVSASIDHRPGSAYSGRGFVISAKALPGGREPTFVDVQNFSGEIYELSYLYRNVAVYSRNAGFEA
ncbi:hypothetical protein BSFA1_82390 (plasmid) [Burkholderia sp. SFA1]|nr:hypothetical protein BSFA1_82390 [Burkholderia sp. SFA1]